MKIIVFWFKFHLILFPSVLFTVNHPQFRQHLMRCKISTKPLPKPLTWIASLTIYMSSPGHNDLMYGLILYLPVYKMIIYLFIIKYFCHLWLGAPPHDQLTRKVMILLTYDNTVRCCYDMVSFLQNPHRRHPIAGKVWGVFCGSKLWFIFWISHYSDECNITLYWTAL